MDHLRTRARTNIPRLSNPHWLKGPKGGELPRDCSRYSTLNLFLLLSRNRVLSCEVFFSEPPVRPIHCIWWQTIEPRDLLQQTKRCIYHTL